MKYATSAVTNYKRTAFISPTSEIVQSFGYRRRKRRRVYETRDERSHKLQANDIHLSNERNRSEFWVQAAQARTRI